MNARIIAFYKFVSIENPETLAKTLKSLAHSLKVKGTVLLANEGINGTLAGSEPAIVSIKTFLNQEPFSDLKYKDTESKTIPFKKLLIKVKPEILTLGDKNIQPTLEKSSYIQPDELKRALDNKEDITLIDIRNNFEVLHGTFDGAINPQTKSFSDFPQFADKLPIKKDSKIVTFCTGGIRCEKGALILKRAGFENVLQLEGGILNYFAQVKGAPHFTGKCFVFDERELLNSNLESCVD